jgi:hypothetical protein
MKSLSFRRQRTRREALVDRAHDALAPTYWKATRWYCRQLRASLPPGAVRWSAIAGGAGVSAALGSVLLRRRTRPAHDS